MIQHRSNSKKLSRIWFQKQNFWPFTRKVCIFLFVGTMRFQLDNVYHFFQLFSHFWFKCMRFNWRNWRMNAKSRRKFQKMQPRPEKRSLIWAECKFSPQFFLLHHFNCEFPASALKISSKSQCPCCSWYLSCKRRSIICLRMSIGEISKVFKRSHKKTR